MIYDEPGEIVQRYGKTGWRVIARVGGRGDPYPCRSGLLVSFFDSQRGYWSSYSEDSCGMNEISWETRGDIVHFENEYTGCKAKIMRSTLLEVISNLHAWKNAGQPWPEPAQAEYPSPEMDTDTAEGEEYIDPTACEGCGYLKSSVEAVETEYGLSRLCAECREGQKAKGIKL